MSTIDIMGSNMNNMVVKTQKEKNMINRNIFKKLTIFLVVAFLCSTFVYAGDASRVGTAAGVQVQVPVGARAIAMGGADIAGVSSIDALFWNPAGLGNMEARAAGNFSSQNIIADINVNYFALGFNAGKLGVIGFSLKSFNFGDIPITTRENMDGTGSMYSPTFATMGMTYSRSLTDHVNVGVTGKMVYESIPRASATAFAADLGIQYKNLMSIDGLGFGFVIKNVGANMQYDGSALLTKARDKDESYDDYRYRPSSSDQLPSSLEMGLSYMKNIGVGNLLVCTQFQNNNFEQDRVKVGAEFELMNMLYLRGGYDTVMKDADNPDSGETIFGLSLGAGLKYNVGGVNMMLDYAYRPMQYFGNSNVFSIGLGF